MSSGSGFGTFICNLIYVLFHVRFASRVNPRQLNSSNCSIFILSTLKVRVCVFSYVHAKSHI